ncbi:hypothetical protein IGL98_002571 [Enterococcus sp. DIV0840]|uniref:DUF1433 domain-containing protein n=1 Tax=Enterococcus TaxID=1350 RepID=UPI001A90C179|nr:MULTISPECIES: DUF1433 domain-containing protein [Enterococcus]MBO0434358.1 DUF1433 domain-containing protein [Enterococcus sp. DIV0849a]MBO0474647.1 DUF1433 domain-containing protein [Enterococcus ureasiticus]
MIRKKYIFLSILMLTIILAFGGCKSMEESEMNYYMKEQKPRIEKFLKYHYNNIDSVTLTGTQKNPMGGFFIQGYINGDENLSISVQGEVGTNIEYVDGLNIDFDKKNNKSNNNKSVSEIEAEEKTTMSSSARMSLWKEKYGSKTT